MKLWQGQVMEMPLRLMCSGKKERLKEKDFQRIPMYWQKWMFLPSVHHIFIIIIQIIQERPAQKISFHRVLKLKARNI